ncbi:MAG TPA: hypothetical protein VFP90_16095 [Gemmatimonadaceae bacterium]|jgi:hypothetical protein|nr:hypothetical protein [Gemmatimonadaceae bacterium]
MPPRRRAAELEDRFISMRAVLLLVVALLASAAPQRAPRGDGATSLAARGSHELHVAMLRASVPTLARSQVQSGDGSTGARGAHPLVANASVPTLGAPIAARATAVDRAGRTAARRGALPSSRAPPLA